MDRARGTLEHIRKLLEEVGQSPVDSKGQKALTEQIQNLSEEYRALIRGTHVCSSSPGISFQTMSL